MDFFFFIQLLKLLQQLLVTLCKLEHQFVQTFFSVSIKGNAAEATQKHEENGNESTLGRALQLSNYDVSFKLSRVTVSALIV